MQIKTCPRCGASFLCQPENPTQCQCAALTLTDAARKQLHAVYPGACLCAKCLSEFIK